MKNADDISTISTTTVKMHANQMTPDQMNEASRKATAEGMKQIAEALAQKQKEAEIEEDFYKGSDNDDSSSASSGSSDESRRERRRRKSSRKQKKNPSGSIVEDKLEGRIHYLQLDLANAKVDTETAQDEVRALKAVYEPYKKANDNLALIHSAMDRSTKGLEDLSIKQLEMKIKLFADETKEHLLLLSVAVDKMQLSEMKGSMERIIASERRKFSTRLDDLRTVVWWRQAKGRAINAGLATLALLFFILLLRLMF